MKQVALGNVVFSLDDLLKDSKPYLKLIRLHTKPEIFVRREAETKDKYLKRLFNNLCRKGFLLEDTKAVEEMPTDAPAEAPVEANHEPTKEIEVVVYKTESVLKSEASNLTSDIVDKINSICSIEIYESSAPMTTVLLRYLEDLRAKAISVAHIASLLP